MGVIQKECGHLGHDTLKGTVFGEWFGELSWHYADSDVMFS